MTYDFHILHLEDNPNDAELVRYALESGGVSCRIVLVTGRQAFCDALDQLNFDIILADFSLPDYNGLAAFDEVQARELELPFVLVTGALGEERAIESIRAGISDYVLKTNLARLASVVPRAIAEKNAEWQHFLALEDLRLSEERFDLAVRGSGAGIWDWPDLRNEDMWWSPRIFEILGYAEGDLDPSIKQWRELILSEDQEDFSRGLDEHLQTRSAYDTEYRMRHKSGDIVWVRSRGSAIWNKQGVAIRMAGYLQDISDRKEAQKNLDVREKDLLRAQRVAHIGSWNLDIPANRLDWTEETYRIFGLTPEEFDGTVQAFLARVHPGDLQRVTEIWSAALAGQTYDLEHRILIGSEVRWVREVAILDFSPSGEPLRAVGVVHDLTAQRSAEAESNQLNESYRAITQTVNEAIIMMDTTGEICFWNPAASKIFGFIRDEAMGKDLHQLLAPQHYHPAANQGMREFFTQGTGPALGKTMEVYGLHSDGHEIPLELSLARIRQNDEWHAVGVLRDISERRAAEHEVSALHRQLAQTQKMEAIGTLAGGIAHDFNNILAAIIGYSSLVESRLPAESRDREDMKRVLQAGTRAKNLVRQILTFARKTELEQHPVAVDLIVKEVLQLIRASLPATIDIVSHVDADGQMVLGSPTEVHQVVMNLCTNSFHAMEGKGGSLEVMLHRTDLIGHDRLFDGCYLLLQVKDSGKGIEPQLLEKIFEPYFTTKEIDRGTGLGLSVVQGIVQRLGGTVEVVSEVGVGSCFTVWFPCCAEEFVEETVMETLVEGGNEHIMYVDDEKGLAILGQEFLEDMGYTVTPMFSSTEALEAFEADPQAYDLVVTDQTMPGMTGVEMALEMAKISPTTPIVLCSGFKMSLDSPGVAETSIREVLLKPEVFDKLPQVLRRLLDKGH